MPPFTHGKPIRGFALVAVLAVMALCTLVILAFFLFSQAEFRGERSDFAQGRARGMAENVVNIALAQLREATTQQFPDGTPKPWTSQPGAIRVHGMDGSLETLHKLYTATRMEVTSPDGLENDVPDDWHTRPDEFVDLNAPRITHPKGSAQLAFPIVDPRARGPTATTSVEGFDYAEIKGAIGPGAGADAQRLPMPVRWVYMLQNGSLATPDASGHLIPAQADSPPDENNPVIGRFAYWVDDETCKVNINTAAEGAFWDTPCADTSQERALATEQPTRLEYHRQPGHPAGVCLSSVLLPGYRFYPRLLSAEDNTLLPMDLDDAADLWRLGRLSVAENGTGTSWGGRQTPDWNALWPTSPLPVARQPQYASVDELVFDNASPAPLAFAFSSTNTRKRLRHAFFRNHPEALTRLERAGFFLTAQSAAPEVTLFGTPRIAMWPVDTTNVTCYDRKLALISTIKGRPWFVQRSQSGDGGGDFATLAGGANKQMFDYLHRLTGRPVPGFANPGAGFTTFAAKYGADRDAILMQMLDYLRTSNGADGQVAAGKQFCTPATGLGQISPLQQDASSQPRGLGRVMTVSQIGLMISCRAQVDSQNVIQGAPSAANQALLLKPGDRELEVGFLVEGFVPGQGWSDYRPCASIALVGGLPDAAPDFNAPLPQLRINRANLVPDASTAIMQSTDQPPAAWNGSGGSTGLRGLSQGVIMFKPLVLSAGASGKVDSLKFFGGSANALQLKLAVYDSPDTQDAAHLLQVIPLVLPDMVPSKTNPGVPVPSLPQDLATYPLADRMREAAMTGQGLISASDVVQSLAPAHSDYRQIAAQRWARNRDGTPLFVPHPLWGTQRFAHNLRDATLPVDSTRTQGYIPGLAYAPTACLGAPIALPFVSPGARGSALPEITGDFDNGIGPAPDGPYINRPDDGHWAAALAGRVPYFDTTPLAGSALPPVSVATFSAQRLLPSPVMFGSLPTGPLTLTPWQTLLFRPQPTHYGAQSPPDHALLDLFWSPVIEPDLVSQPFETAGKINLNHVIVPFGYITRATALHAAMKAETLIAIPDTAAATYKTGGKADDRFRHYIDAVNTVKLWQTNVFSQGRVFLTAGQLCEQPLVPEGVIAAGTPHSTAAMEAFWQTHRLTGDNSKERPYAHLYSRFTTRSNTFRVHFIAQSVRKARSMPHEEFDSRRDEVTASIQGTCVLRRELDPDEPNLPDYLAPSSGLTPAQPLDAFYHWRREVVKIVR